ncbi:hypothetical protein [Streptomyces peucetius]|uniref:Lipoprotein CseA n=1 Tax=Streptomyces peucetius TaxID=1950 RepID=A0ABY6I9K2_STRPE|nr:hypothetical protein [Streptomyces peucetius]UYQ63623.1 hypothetical protein OGH68_20610 [Streptomyces peucetius]
MRGLKGKGSSRTMAAGGTATAGLVAVVLLAAGCSTGGTGVQDEGAAPSEAASKATPSPVPSGSPGHFTKRVDAVELLLADPKVSPRVKADLRPCAKDSYPVDTSYAQLTGNDTPDVVINVLTCGDAVGMGTYVYREKDDKAYENVFAVEEPAVYAAVDRGDLVVTKQVYTRHDPVAEPSGEEVSTYRWSDGKFTREFWVRNEFSRAVGDGEVVATEAPAPEEN